MSKITISNVNTDLSSSYMLIEYNNSVPLTKYSKILLQRFMSIINSRLGSRTELNYHIMPIENFKVKVPFYVYTNDEKKLSHLELVEKRVNKLINFLETMDWSTCANLQEIWIVHSLKLMGIDISTDFTLSTFTDEIIGYNDLDKEPLKINFPTIHEPKIERVKFDDGSTIIYLSSKYLNDYGIFANLTIPFSEMGMSFNALHLYEHVMTCGWKNINYSKMKLMNGSTWPNGLCSVFAVTTTLNSMKEFAASYIKYYLNSRDAGFWNQPTNAQNLKLETQRTISETRTERSLSSLCRSDYHAYDFRYNTKIFEYWSNKPFDIFIAGPESLENLHLNATTINQYIKLHNIRKVQKPNNIIYHSIPLDILKMKKLHGYRVVSCEQKEICDSLIHPNPSNKSLYGLDNKMVSDEEDLNPYNIILHVLVYANKLFDDDILNKFAHKTIIPFSCAFFNDTSLCSKFAGDFLYDPLEDDLELFQPFYENESKSTINHKADDDENDVNDMSENISDDDETEQKPKSPTNASNIDEGDYSDVDVEAKQTNIPTEETEATDPSNRTRSDDPTEPDYAPINDKTLDSSSSSEDDDYLNYP